MINVTMEPMYKNMTLKHHKLIIFLKEECVIVYKLLTYKRKNKNNLY